MSGITKKKKEKKRKEKKMKEEKEWKQETNVNWYLSRVCGNNNKVAFPTRI